MKKHLLKHFKYYTLLLIMQIVGLFVILSLNGKKELQIAVIISSTIGYVVWAIAHQYLEHSLTIKIVIEYVLFGAFGLISALLFFR